MTRPPMPVAPRVPVVLALVAATFVAASLVLPQGMRWACLPFVSAATCSVLPWLGRGSGLGGPLATGFLSVIALAAGVVQDGTTGGLAAMAWGVALGGHAAWHAVSGLVPSRS